MLSLHMNSWLFLQLNELAKLINIEIKTIEEVKVNQQKNTYDCGFLVLMFIEGFGSNDIHDISEVSNVAFKH